MCYLFIKEHDEFGVAFKLYFLHSSTIIGSTCVSVWIQEGWIEWLATHFWNSLPKSKYLGKQMEVRGKQKPREANQPSSFLNRHALGQKCNNLKLITYSLMADWYHQPTIQKSWICPWYFKFITKTFATAVA